MTTENKRSQVIAHVPERQYPKCTASTSETGIYQAIVAFFKKRFPDVTVQRGQINRDSLPDPPCAIIQIIGKKRISTEEIRYTNSDKIMHEFHKVMMRIDFWGSEKRTACDLSSQFSTLWNDDSTFEFFQSLNAPLYPLYTDDDRMMVIVDGADQYADRYIRDAYMEYHPEVKIPQESATEIIMSVRLADTTK